MAQLNDLIQANLAVVVVVAVAAYLVLIVGTLVQALRLRRLRRRLDSLTRGADGRSLESVFSAHLDTVLRVAGDLEDVRSRTSAVERTLPLTFQRVGLVRFNPFEDTGGNQSFALALLSGEDNGVVVSSLHSRTGTRVYAKAVKSGRSETALSTEEAQAVELAQNGPSAVALRAAGLPQARPALTARDGNGRPAPAPAPMARPANRDEPIDARFLERRLRGEDEDRSGPSIWGDRSRS